ncbi:hypothetical protein LguiB_005321 [Lonicera macranthoides]
MTNDMFFMGMYTLQTKGGYTNDAISLGRFTRNVCTHSRLNNNRFIDETAVVESAFTALVLRSRFTRTSKISWHNNYWCDPNLIEHNLKEVEGSQHGFYVNMAIKAFLFFPEELPKLVNIEPPSYARKKYFVKKKMRRTLKATPTDGMIPLSRTLSIGNVPRKCRQRDVYAFKMKDEMRLMGQPLLCNLSREAQYKNFSGRILLVRMFSFTCFKQVKCYYSQAYLCDVIVINNNDFLDVSFQNTLVKPEDDDEAYLEDFLEEKKLGQKPFCRPYRLGLINSCAVSWSLALNTVLIRVSTIHVVHYNDLDIRASPTRFSND